MKKTFKAFLEAKGISKEQFTAKEVSEKEALKHEYVEARLKSNEELTTKEVNELKETLKGLATTETVTSLQKQLGDAQEAIDQLKENGGRGSNELSISKQIATEKDNIKTLATEKGKRVEFVVKAQHNPSDIDSRNNYADFEEGTNKLPFRSFSILNMFKRKPMKGEFLKYREEKTVTRDAKVVVKCAKSNHNTAKKWTIKTVQVAKIRDMTDVCLDMIEDYDFVESEVKELVTTGVTSKEEEEILTGTGDVLSIDTISSEFSASNVLAPFDKSFQAPTLAELTAAMKAQVFTFGAQNSWDSNVILMNYNDKVKFMHSKNKNNDYLLPNFVLTNGGVLNGMKIVTSPLVAPNTLYVMDTKQACILDRKATTVEMFYENKDNAEHEVVTIKALKRMQFHVKNIQRNAFMKCTDINAALTAITKV